MCVLRSPYLNAHAERFIRSIKESCLERMILFGEGSLRKAIHEYVAHTIANGTTRGWGTQSSARKPATSPPVARSGGVSVWAGR